MNPGILRNVDRGKHQQTIVEKSHILYDQYQIDILNQDTAKDLLEDEKDAEFLIHFLTTTEPLKKIYSSYKYRIALEQIKTISKSLTNQVKSLRADATRKKNKEKEENDALLISQLKNLSKAYLVKVLIKKLPKDEIKKIIDVGISRKEKRKNNKMSSSKPSSTLQENDNIDNQD